MREIATIKIGEDALGLVETVHSMIIRIFVARLVSRIEFPAVMVWVETELRFLMTEVRILIFASRRRTVYKCSNKASH